MQGSHLLALTRLGHKDCSSISFTAHKNAISMVSGYLEAGLPQTLNCDSCSTCRSIAGIAPKYGVQHIYFRAIALGVYFHA